MIRLWRAALREPLMRFAIAGGLLFAVDAVKSQKTEHDPIVVTPETVQALVRSREAVLDRPVSDLERRELIDGFIVDEVLVREAYARGLDRQDSVVRQRLLEVMRFVVGEEPPEPTADQLRAFLQTHDAIYRTPPALTVSHVFFSEAGEEAPRVPFGLLRRLQTGADYRTFGEHFWLGRTLERYVEPDLQRLFGAAFVRQIAALPLHQWAGPISSNYGVHFVRVDSRFAARIPSYDELVPTLRNDWLRARRAEILTRKADEFRRRYRVDMTTGGER